MAVTKNFDSTALSDGRDMFELMQTTETNLLKERSKLFGKLKNEDISKITDLNQYLLDLSNKFTDMRKELINNSRKAIQRTDRQAEILLNNELTNAFKKGVDKTVKEADEVIGEIPETTPQAELIKQRALNDIRQSQLNALNSTLNDFTQVSGLVIGAVFTSRNLGQKKTLYDIVDQEQRKFNAKGITGKQAGNREISLTSYNETVVRENSQQIMLQGTGAVETPHDRVYVSQHASASDACRPHQGKYYIDDVFRQGKRGKYTNLPLLSSVVDKKGRPGLFHFNCRHTVTYAPEGFDPVGAPDDAKTNKNGRVNEAKAKQTYQVEQKQRALQRNIRQYKQVKANALTEQERSRADGLVKDNQARLRQLEQFAKKNNIPFYRQSNKENIEFKFETFKPEF